MLSTPSADTTQTTPSYPPENFLCPWVSFARDQLNLHSHKQSTQPHCAQQLVVQGGSDLLVLWSTFAPEEGSQHDGDLNHHGILFSYGMCSPCELIKLISWNSYWPSHIMQETAVEVWGDDVLWSYAGDCYGGMMKYILSVFFFSFVSSYFNAQ